MENFIFCAVIVITLTYFVPNQASFTCTKPTAEPHRITETRYILIKTLPTKIFDLFKNLNIASCNPTEPLCWEHCQPYYWICECNNVTTSECNNEHLNLFRFVDLGLWFSLGLFRNVLPQVTMRYHTHYHICYHTFMKILHYFQQLLFSAHYQKSYWISFHTFSVK